MRTIGLATILVLLGLAVGCDLEVTRTSEGTLVTGPAGGWFVCDDESNCDGHTGP